MEKKVFLEFLKTLAKAAVLGFVCGFVRKILKF